MGHEGMERADCAPLAEELPTHMQGQTSIRTLIRTARRTPVSDPSTSRSWWTLALALFSVICMGFASTAQAQLIRPPEKLTYTNRFDVYGGIGLDTMVAGRTLLKRMNFGEFEAQGTYWMVPRFGLVADLRGEGGTTPVNANPYKIDRASVYQFMAMGGLQMRGARNQHFALNYHALVGAAHGLFDTNIGNTQPQQVGMFPNSTSPVAALGISLDINRGAHWAVRIQPDAMIRAYDSSDVTEDFSMSAGILYRFGKRK